MPLCLQPAGLQAEGGGIRVPDRHPMTEPLLKKTSPHSIASAAIGGHGV